MEIGTAVRESSGVVTGWRAWVVTRTEDGLRLASVLHDLVWPIETPIVAECRRHEDPFADPVLAHPVPGAVCGCGFHAARDPADALSYARGRDEPGTVCRVLGEVSLWGHVLETQGGWRASHAYPVRLFVPDADIGAALGVYGCVISWAECDRASATSSKAGLAGSSTSAWSGARTPSWPEVASG
jgi:hypothetical protein